MFSRFRLMPGQYPHPPAGSPQRPSEFADPSPLAAMVQNPCYKGYATQQSPTSYWSVAVEVMRSAEAHAVWRGHEAGGAPVRRPSRSRECPTLPRFLRGVGKPPPSRSSSAEASGPTGRTRTASLVCTPRGRTQHTRSSDKISCSWPLTAADREPRPTVRWSYPLPL